VRPEENDDVVRAFLAGNGDFAPAAPALAPEGAVLEDGRMTLLPHRTGMDGFFIATLVRL
jgi:16S rRNA C967 or C1407 C5-methylase (RsmB/RsmF family)